MFLIIESAYSRVEIVRLNTSEGRESVFQVCESVGGIEMSILLMLFCLENFLVGPAHLSLDCGHHGARVMFTSP